MEALIDVGSLRSAYRCGRAVGAPRRALAVDGPTGTRGLRRRAHPRSGVRRSRSRPGRHARGAWAASAARCGSIPDRDAALRRLRRRAGRLLRLRRRDLGGSSLVAAAVLRPSRRAGPRRRVRRLARSRCDRRSSETPSPAPGDFRARPGGMPLIDADEALAVAAEGVLLDARAPERFRGEVEPIDPVAGHIPGAVSAPNAGNVSEDGTLLSAQRAARTVRGPRCHDRRAGRGVLRERRHRGQHVLALEVAGFEQRCTPDSWSGWITDRSRTMTCRQTGPSREWVSGRRRGRT